MNRWNDGEAMARRANRKPSERKRVTARVPVVVLVLLIAAGVYAVWPRSRAAPPGEAEVTEFPHIHGMAVDPGDPDVLYLGTHGMLLKVINKTQWVRVGRSGYDLMGFNIHPTRPGTLITSGHPGPGDRRPNPLGLEVSRDGGQTWTPLSMAGLADFHAMAVSPADPQVIYAWNVSGRVGFYKSSDGGATWTVLPASLRRVYALAALPGDPSRVVAGTDAGLLRSADGGITWTAATLINVPVTSVAVHPAQPQIWYAYAAPPGAGLMRSGDGGTTWAPTGFSVGDRDAVGYLAPHPTDPNQFYMATYESHLFWSGDGGRTQRQLARAGRVLRP